MRTPPGEVMPLRVGGPRLESTWKIYPGRPLGLPGHVPDAKLPSTRLAPSVAMLPWGRTPIPEARSVTDNLDSIATTSSLIHPAALWQEHVSRGPHLGAFAVTRAQEKARSPLLDLSTERTTYTDNVRNPVLSRSDEPLTSFGGVDSI